MKTAEVRARMICKDNTYLMDEPEVKEIIKAWQKDIDASQLKDNRNKIIEKQGEQNKELKKYVNLLKDSLDLLADNNLIKEDKGKLHISELLSDMANIGAELNKNIEQLESELASLRSGKKEVSLKDCGNV
jgi:hypothetical protein